MKKLTGIALLALLAACQPADLREAAVDRAIEIAEAEIPGVGDIALTDVTVGTDDGEFLYVCATASAANLPPRPIIANITSGTLTDEALMRLNTTIGREPDECSIEAAERFDRATGDKLKKWRSEV